MCSEEITIFVGNPGSGKSTLLNSLAGKILFQSGVSFGQGMTTAVETGQGNDGKLYGDTPGLDDVEIRAKAAEEINKILREYEAVKLCFVITLEAGRVKPADKATLEVILDALPISTANRFSIIINKLEKSLIAQFKNPEKLGKILLQLTSEKHITSHIYLVPKDDAAYDEENKMLSNVQILRSALETAPIFRYHKADVKDIKHDAFEDMQKKFAVDLEEIRKANSEQLERMARQHDEALARAKEEAKKERDRFASQIEEMNAEHQERIDALKDKIAEANKSPSFWEVVGTVAVVAVMLL